VLTGLATVDRLERGRLPLVPSPSRKAYVYAALSLLLGIAAMPAVVTLSSNLLGVVLAALGVVAGAYAAMLSLTRRRGGFSLAMVGIAVCGSFLFVATMLAGGPGGGRSGKGWWPRAGKAPRSIVPRLDGSEQRIVTEYLRRNLDDPVGMEIVEWGEFRSVRLRSRERERQFEDVVLHEALAKEFGLDPLRAPTVGVLAETVAAVIVNARFIVVFLVAMIRDRTFLAFLAFRAVASAGRGRRGSCLLISVSSRLYPAVHQPRHL
jgi:hypothetical protein